MGVDPKISIKIIKCMKRPRQQIIIHTNTGSQKYCGIL